MYKIPYTAKVQAKNLKEHEDGFIAARGIKEEPVPVTDHEVIHHIITLARQERVTLREAKEVAGLVVRLTNRKIRISGAYAMLSRALGYENWETAKGAVVEVGEGRHGKPGDNSYIVSRKSPEERNNLSSILQHDQPCYDAAYNRALLEQQPHLIADILFKVYHLRFDFAQDRTPENPWKTYQWRQLLQDFACSEEATLFDYKRLQPAIEGIIAFYHQFILYIDDVEHYTACLPPGFRVRSSSGRDKFALY